MGWPYRVSEGQHLVCFPAQDQNNPPENKTSSMRLFPRQAETSAFSVRSLLYAGGLEIGREKARPAPTDLALSSQEARQALAPGQARGLLIPCLI